MGRVWGWIHHTESGDSPQKGRRRSRRLEIRGVRPQPSSLDLLLLAGPYGSAVLHLTTGLPDSGIVAWRRHSFA